MALALLLTIPIMSQARVTELVVTSTESPTFGGVSFGTVGQYEKLTGIIKCEVNPKHPLNTGIVNINKAPKKRQRSRRI